MGMTKQEITRKLDEIVDFSGCERYIDTPVKRYSSGMTVRLGFAIAAHLEPEILVVDEVLAVGDAEFQKKAIGKMQDVSKGGGRTVLFVSHNMASVKKLCNTGVLLQNGMVKCTGAIDDVIREYTDSGSKVTQNVFFENLSEAPGNDQIRIKSVEVFPENGDALCVASGVHIRWRFMNYKPDILLDAAFELRTSDDMIIIHSGKVVSPQKDSKVGEYTVDIIFPPFLLNKGRYNLRMWFGENNRYLIWGDYIHYFEVEDSYYPDPYLERPLPGILKMKLNASSTFSE